MTVFSAFWDSRPRAVQIVGATLVVALKGRDKPCSYQQFWDSRPLQSPEVFSKHFLQLFNFGTDGECAVRLVRILVEIVLMIVFSRKEI